MAFNASAITELADGTQLSRRTLYPLRYFPDHDDFLAVEINRFVSGDEFVEVAIPVFIRNLASELFSGAPSPTEARRMARDGRKRYLAYALKRVETAIELSAERGWPEEFKRLRRLVAHRYLERAIYYTVGSRDPNSGEESINGTYRDIFAPYSQNYQQRYFNVEIRNGSHGEVYKSFFFCPWRKTSYQTGTGPILDLPMEWLLGIKLPRPILFVTYNSDLDPTRPLREWMNDISFIGQSRYHRLSGEGVLMEPGNFAIRRSHNKTAAGKILVHLLQASKYPMRRAGLDPSEILYCTYGNRASKRQYSHEGFEEISQFRGQGFPLRHLRKAPPYLWYPLSAKYKDLHEYFLTIQQKRNLSTEDVERVRSLYDALDDYCVGKAEQEKLRYSISHSSSCETLITEDQSGEE